MRYSGKVFSVGDLNIDIFMRLGSRFVPGEEHSAETMYYTPGGNAANFAIALGSLGGNTTLISTLGEDVFTDYLKKSVRKAGADLFLVSAKSATADSLGNGISSILISDNGERAIISRKGKLSLLTTNGVSKKLLPSLKKGDIVFFGGFFHLPGFRNGFPNFLQKIRNKGASVFFDTTFDTYGKWIVKPFIKYVDLLFLNEKELLKITRVSERKKAVQKLISWGVRKVVLKRGRKGAEFYSTDSFGNLSVLSIPRSPVKPVNTTGAGDFFNAGFVYGLSHGFSALNSLEIGSFVAANKFGSDGYTTTSHSALSKFVSSRNLAQTIKLSSYSKLSKAAAEQVISQLAEKPDSVISLPAGKTPIGLYKELVSAYRKRKVSFSKAIFVELDEYVGEISEKESFAHFLRKNFFSKVDFKGSNIHMFSADQSECIKACKKIDAVIEKNGGIDLTVLGIGANCHIAFDEPGSSFNSGTRIVDISKAILKKRGRKFSKKFPDKAATLGMKTIFNSHKLVLIANGAKKASAIRNAVKAEPSEKFPASILQKHRNSLILVDNSAGKFI